MADSADKSASQATESMGTRKRGSRSIVRRIILGEDKKTIKLVFYTSIIAHDEYKYVTVHMLLITNQQIYTSGSHNCSVSCDSIT